MALPLPKVIPDAPQGGYVMGGLEAVNALTKGNLENEYYPMKMKADTASKLAYANLMGPQFLAKLMANDPILANMTEEQKTNALRELYQAGTGQGTGNAMINGNGNSMPSGNGNAMTGGGIFGNGALNAFVNYLMPKQQQANQPQSQPMQPSQQQPNSQQSVPTVIDHNETVRDDRLAQWMSDGYARNAPIPDTYRPDLIPGRKKTFAENTANQKGIVEEGGALGKTRAKDIEGLGDLYQSAVSQSHVFDDLVSLSNSPQMQNLKNKVPLFQSEQMKVLSKIGTPEEQEMVGQFYNSTNELVKNTINSFQGNKLVGEANLARDMKVNPNDTWSTMIGKLQSAMTYNEYNKQLTSLTTKIMKDQHMDKQSALEIADKQLDGKKIRSNIYNKLHPKPTDADIKFMADKYKVSEAEIRKRLKVKGHL